MILISFGGFVTLKLWGQTDLTALGLLYSVPMLAYGILLLVAYIFSPRLQPRFSTLALYLWSFGLIILIGVFAFITLLATPSQQI